MVENDEYYRIITVFGCCCCWIKCSRPVATVWWGWKRRRRVYTTCPGLCMLHCHHHFYLLSDSVIWQQPSSTSIERRDGIYAVTTQLHTLFPSFLLVMDMMNRLIRSLPPSTTTMAHCGCADACRTQPSQQLQQQQLISLSQSLSVYFINA